MIFYVGSHDANDDDSSGDAGDYVGYKEDDDWWWLTMRMKWKEGSEITIRVMMAMMMIAIIIIAMMIIAMMMIEISVMMSMMMIAKIINDN